MTWNYRICKYNYLYRIGAKKKRETLFSIREVYYDKKGKVDGWTKDAIKIDGLCNRDEVIKTLEMMLSDARKHKVLWVGNEKATGYET